MRERVVLGLMSGTSADGVDAALLRVTPAPAAGDGAPVVDAGGPVRADTGDRAEGALPPWPRPLPRATTLCFRDVPHPPPLQEAALSVAAGVGGAREVALLRREVTLAFARAAGEVLVQAGVAPGEVDAVGCHGQTVWHEPPGRGAHPGVGTPGTSLQLLDPALLAERTGVPVVSDFRSADLAAGGEGAPLVPWPDQVLFAVEGAARALLNVGGVANVTRVPARESREEPLAFDTGPGNALMDEAVRLATGGARNRDTDGAMAAAGAVDPALLARLLDDPFLKLAPPRSTGRERFGSALVRELAGERGLAPGGDGWTDLLATLAAFTVESAATALERWVLPPGVVSVVVTGGGARNPVLVSGLRARLAPLPVETGADALGGGDPDAREAAAFALLAWAYLEGVPGNVPGCTGAAGPRVLGSWTPAPRRGS